MSYVLIFINYVVNDENIEIKNVKMFFWYQALYIIHL